MVSTVRLKPAASSAPSRCVRLKMGTNAAVRPAMTSTSRTSSGTMSAAL